MAGLGLENHNNHLEMSFSMGCNFDDVNHEMQQGLKFFDIIGRALKFEAEFSFDSKVVKLLKEVLEPTGPPTEIKDMFSTLAILKKLNLDFKYESFEKFPEFKEVAQLEEINNTGLLNIPRSDGKVLMRMFDSAENGVKAYLTMEKIGALDMSFDILGLSRHLYPKGTKDES